MLDFTSLELALERIRQGKMVILVDDESRENEGDLVFAADSASRFTDDGDSQPITQANSFHGFN